jgi:hypothetical protein
VLLNKTTKETGGVYDRRPSNVEGLVKSSIAGFYFENTGYVSLMNSAVTWGANKPAYAGKAIEQKNTAETRVVNFQENKNGQ